MAIRQLLPPVIKPPATGALPHLAALPRLPDAPQRFHALLSARWAMPFEWGHNDCVLWAADAVQALLGQDPAEPLRGHYATAAGAARVLRDLTGRGGPRALAGAVLGRQLAAPLLAGVGDVGYTESGTLAVCIGQGWTAPGRSGLVLLPLQAAAVAWRVGACRKL